MGTDRAACRGHNSAVRAEQRAVVEDVHFVVLIAPSDDNMAAGAVELKTVDVLNT